MINFPVLCYDGYMKNNKNGISGIFYRLTKNVAECFSGKNLLWQFLAMILTFVLVISDFDGKYYEYFQNSAISKYLFPAVFIGLLVPVVTPAIFLIWGLIKKSGKTLNTGYALIQAAALGWLMSAFYKTFTGRLGPPEHIAQSGLAAAGGLSKVFNFGFLRGGVFWGWPSSHTTTAFAFALTLVMLYPKSKTIKFLALFYAVYVGVGVSMSIHWFSDFAAGAFFGSIVGIVVGKAFYNRLLTNN